ncbi:DUF1576 domain-containing protein [Chakrabartyella piscis]|uniref:DUF1576 domain-containing protein n=1 Tax=Chakrabartyella piscis TaxID=2918914 RepID=UPI0029586CED|nr:DUF1576 domain-containing protein [Chakrabartyella piscis]
MLEKIKEAPIKSFLYYVSFCLLIFSLVTANPIATVKGLGPILLSSSTLITDYMGISSMSSAFLNAAIVSFFTLFLFHIAKIQYNGTSIASFFLMAGFSLFGKNFLNIIPVFLGVYVYALVNKDSFRKYIYAALFGTSIAPIVSEVIIHFSGRGITLQSIIVGTIIGGVCGFLLPALSVECLRVLQGFNLYNIGFATGLIGIFFTAAFKSFGFGTEIRMIWTTGRSPILCVFLYALFLSFILFGYLLNDKSFQNYPIIFRHSGRAVADFTVMDGFPLTLINMGVVSTFALSYLIVLNGDVNGPTIGALFTVAGFGAMGKHLKNMCAPMFGVFFMSMLAHWSLKDPSVQLAALFCTGLAPITGQYGFGWGIVAGAMHSLIVLSVTTFHGGLNLYNNGFAAGLVVMLLIPTIESFMKDN